MMRFTKAGAILVIALSLCAAATSAHAFSFSGIGGKVGFLKPEDVDGTFVLSAHAEFEKHGSRVHLTPGVAYWSKDFVTDFNPNFDIYYHFKPEGTVTPFVGGGLGMHFYSFDGPIDGESDFGANIFGGVRFPGDRTHFFLEGRYAITDLGQLSILGGVTFHMGD